MAFDHVAYMSQVINPLRDHPGGVPANDLAGQYAVTPDMTAGELRTRLREVRSLWQRRQGGVGAAANVCAQLIGRDERLRAEHGDAMYDPGWWTRQARAHEDAVHAESRRFAEVLRNAYGAVGRITAEQLAAIATQWPSLSKLGADEAVRLAGLRLVEPIELPAASGLPGSAYRRLLDLQRQLDVPTVVQLIRPELTGDSFALLGRDAVDLGLETLARRRQEMERAADSHELRAGKEALGLLDTAARNGVDLRTVALFQLVERLQDLRARNLADALLIESATGAGLLLPDAQTVVSNLPAPTVTGPADRVRELLAEGQLRAAAQAVAQVPETDPAHAELRQTVGGLTDRVDELRRDAEQAIRDGHEEEAAQRLRDALRIADDDEDLRRRAEALPPPPVRELVARVTEQGVRLGWSAPHTAVPELLRYRVVRSDRAPRTAADGDVVVAGLSTPEAVDKDPAPARDLHYGVFASTGGDWSRAAVTVERVLPPVTAVQVRTQHDEIVCSWRVHPAAETVRVRRTTGRPPTGPDDGTPIACTRAGLTDDAGDADVFYGIVAVYRDAAGAEAFARTVVARATTGQAAPPFVSRIRVHAVAVDASTATANVTWAAPAAGTVSVRRSDAPPAWPAGATVSRGDVEAYGEPLIGDRLVQGPEVQLEATVPSGRHYYTAFTLHPTADTAIVGEPVAVAVIEPVTRLLARRNGGEVTVSWVWPPSVNLAEVTFTPAGAATPSARELVSRGQFTAKGCHLPIGHTGGRVAVQSVVRGMGGESKSSAVTAPVDGTAATVSWQVVKAGGFLSRRRELRLTTDTRCEGVEVRLVAGPGDVLPVRAEQGIPVAHLAGLELDPDVPEAVPFTMPAKVRWLRCFVTRPAGVRVNDPPIDEMKVS
ncbi:hypothetical protein [Paractinoplanes lichenicola]|uniref:Fibronectin type-III domain-containing protein n=1 Tax=Paractinoplanes lichenicola TaxID=2802976 RepID=A0ABS1VU72_9ACTN|nr:hypothetical protein [Actinoplanes lichenicola]MBL7258034.1 hypothetical protein [Actinoplanes lichenicola]